MTDRDAKPTDDPMMTVEAVVNLFDLPEQEVIALSRRGVLPRIRDGRLPLVETTRRYCRHLRDGLASDTARATVLADWLGVSEQTVRELAVRGVVERRGRGLYSLKASIRKYCDTMRQTLTGRGGEAQAATAAAERARLAKAMADKVELANARQRGALLDAGAVEAEWASILRTVRAGMLAVASRAAQRLPHLTTHDAAEIDAEVRAALSEIANGPVGGGGQNDRVA